MFLGLVGCHIFWNLVNVHQQNTFLPFGILFIMENHFFGFKALHLHFVH